LLLFFGAHPVRKPSPGRPWPPDSGRRHRRRSNRGKEQRRETPQEEPRQQWGPHRKRVANQTSSTSAIPLAYPGPQTGSREGIFGRSDGVAQQLLLWKGNGRNNVGSIQAVEEGTP